jgi:hypothetical protein
LNLSADFGRTKTKARQCFNVELATGRKAPGLFGKKHLNLTCFKPLGYDSIGKEFALMK